MIFKKIKDNKFTIVWAIIILILLLLPARDLPNTKKLFKNADKIAHFGLFVIFIIANKIDKIRSKTTENYAKFIVYAIIFAGATEILQLLLTNDRHFDIYDFVADTTGLIVGWTAIKIHNSIKSRQNPYNQ